MADKETTVEDEKTPACFLLHWVFKIRDLPSSLSFFERVLGLRVLRHEENASGCEITCNGPYARPWSKTMLGTGPEDEHFALELTYNYNLKSYRRGSDLEFIAFDDADRVCLTRVHAYNEWVRGVLSRAEQASSAEAPDQSVHSRPVLIACKETVVSGRKATQIHDADGHGFVLLHEEAAALASTQSSSSSSSSFSSSSSSSGGSASPGASPSPSVSRGPTGPPEVAAGSASDSPTLRRRPAPTGEPPAKKARHDASPAGDGGASKWPGPQVRDPFLFVSLRVTDLARSVEYYCTVLQMRVLKESKAEGAVLLGYRENETGLRLVQVSADVKQIDHAEDSGRLALATRSGGLAAGVARAKCLADEKKLGSFLHENFQPMKVQRPRASTPSEQGVGGGDAKEEEGVFELVILLDPDGYEICYLATNETFKWLWTPLLPEAQGRESGVYAVDWKKRRDELGAKESPQALGYAIDEP